MPRDLLARSGESTVVDGFSFRPNTTSSGRSKELTGFHVHSPGLSTGNDGEEKGDKFWERQFSVSGKMLGQTLPCGVDFTGNDFKKSLRVPVKLA